MNDKGSLLGTKVKTCSRSIGLNGSFPHHVCIPWLRLSSTTQPSRFVCGNNICVCVELQVIVDCLWAALLFEEEVSELKWHKICRSCSVQTLKFQCPFALHDSSAQNHHSLAEWVPKMWVMDETSLVNKGDKDFVWGLWKSMSFRGDKSHTISQREWDPLIMMGKIDWLYM